MQITSQNIAHHELIGLRVLIIDHSNPSNVGLSARVVNESKNTFTIESDSREKMIPKDRGIFEFILPDGQHTVLKGDLLVARPEDRIVKNLLKVRKR